MDKAEAPGTILFDLAARDWSAEVARRRWGSTRPGCRRRSRGPQVTGDGHRRGRRGSDGPARRARRSWPAAATRRPTRSASGVVDPGTMALSLGTSGVVFAATDAPLFEPRGRVHAFCHAVPGRWHMMSVMLSAAGSLRWFRDALAPGVEFGDLVDGGRRGPGGQRRPALPALPVRRAQPAPRSAGAWRVRRARRSPTTGAT